jgi:CubicO group peptidase (beta-lactamase class C family)
VPLAGYSVDREAKTATAWILPSFKRTAVFREGLGVALALDENLDALRAQARPEAVEPLELMRNLPWPMGDAPSGQPKPTGFDEGKVAAAVEHMFSEPSGYPLRNTRAVVVAYKGEIIAEKYAAGYGPEDRHAGWSTAKSVFHALFGMAVRDGKVRLDDAAPIPAWQGEDDPRRAITLDALLRMNSGIALSDFDFDRRPRVAELLFARSGAAEYMMGRPLAHPPATHFAYASGSTNLLSWVLRQRYGDEAYYTLPRELFRKLGMRSALIEADATGTLIGSSFFHATPRDFARFGLLYANDGVWQGERILPEGWVELGRTPSPCGPGSYGAHWWLGGVGPHAAFGANGYEGQKILVVPSLQLVVVRLGLCYFSDFPLYEEMPLLLEAFPEAK